MNRIRGRCTQDPSYGPTTVAPEKCWFIKPAFPDDYELAGPCVFPLNHEQQCRIKCGDKGFGFAQCQCRHMLKSLEIGGGIDFSGGIDFGIDIGDSEPTLAPMTTLDPHDSTQFDGIASCDFILPKLCQTGPAPTESTGGVSMLSGCRGQTENVEIRINCGGLTQQVGPNSKCPATCLNDPLEEEHEAFCRCNKNTGCHWELKAEGRCQELDALTCPTPNWSQWPSELSLDCHESRLDFLSRRKVSKWRKKRKKRKRTMNQCLTVCRNEDYEFDGVPADCICTDGECQWSVPSGTCKPTNFCRLPNVAVKFECLYKGFIIPKTT